MRIHIANIVSRFINTTSKHYNFFNFDRVLKITQTVVNRKGSKISELRLPAFTDAFFVLYPSCQKAALKGGATVKSKLSINTFIHSIQVKDTHGNSQTSMLWIFAGIGFIMRPICTSIYMKLKQVQKKWKGLTDRYDIRLISMNIIRLRYLTMFMNVVKRFSFASKSLEYCFGT